MTTLTLIIALMLTAGSVLLTSVLASRYGINDENSFLRGLIYRFMSAYFATIADGTRANKPLAGRP